MTATILLIRHAAHAHLGQVLSGRTAGGSLTDEGREQARKLSQGLARQRVAEVFSSPVTRACETAAEVACAHDLVPQLADPLDEIDFGEWSGQSFEELSSDPRWVAWNEHRATAGAPEGETMIEVQQRMMGFLESLGRRAPGQVTAVVSHCDTIRAAIAGILGLSLDYILRFDISPASVSKIQIGDWGARVLTMNEVHA